LLQDKIGNSVLLQDNEGNLLGEGALQLVNENSEGNYSLFLKEANGFDSLVSIPKNQAVVQKEDGISFKFADKNILISTIEKSKIPNKPVEMEKAEENAKHARNLEKMRNFNEWQKKADSYARTANGQKDWFFGDMEIAADAEGLEFGVKNRIIKKADTLFKEIKRNATRDDKAEIYSALIGAFEVKSVAKAKAVISNLKKKGYEIDADQLDQPKDKENFFTRIKISKGENDPLPKELQFATGEYALAFEECAKKPNPLRETEMSLGLKINAEGVPEFNTIKKQLFNLAGEGLGQLWVTGGLPGSGKSSTLGGEFYKNKVLIDPDKIKYMLAEERGISQEEVNKKPWELHEESSNIAKHLVREAIREKKDVIYDVTMKGTENLNDLLYMVNSDTFQANAEFIHLPIEKGIERDKARGESGGRSIGADLYKKLFGGYPTHKAFFELKDSFDNFRVYDNSAPLGEGAKLFYVKNDGQEKILHPGIHDEFKKFGLKQMGKSLYLRYQRRKLVKAIEPTPKTNETQLPKAKS
jgi:predicted ABC-type ATPase